MFDLAKQVRPSVARSKAYSTARDEGNKVDVMLDANENPYENALNRYPDPLAQPLRVAIAAMQGVETSNLLVSNGSDEALEWIFKTFCDPGDKVVSCSPCYGMYQVLCDQFNGVSVDIPLDERFQPNVERIVKEGSAKMLLLTAPNNPTGNDLDIKRVRSILDQFPGLVVIDEAYVEFTERRSWIRKVGEYPNLIVLRTFSKAYGLAGLRLGYVVAQPDIIDLFKKVKLPYNIDTLKLNTALKILENASNSWKEISEIKSERNRLNSFFATSDKVKRIWPSDANFLLIEVDNANEVYARCKEENILVRNRKNAGGLGECLRITIGTPRENNRLMEVWKTL